MKKGQVYKSREIYYVLVNDYGHVRPLVLNGRSPLEMNTDFKLCPRVDDAKKMGNGFYHGDELVAETLEEFFKTWTGDEPKSS
ncbi:MAG: hypothetical protein ACKOX6_12905 [Bdellovibrio sp.]